MVVAHQALILLGFANSSSPRQVWQRAVSAPSAFASNNLFGGVPVHDVIVFGIPNFTPYSVSSHQPPDALNQDGFGIADERAQVRE